MVSVRTFGDALLDSKPIIGDAAALLEGPLLKRVAIGGDALIDAAAINAAMPDDAAKKAAKKVQKNIFDDMAPGGVNALFNATNSARIKQRQGGLSFVGTEEMEQGRAGNPVQRPREPEVSALDQGVGLAEKALQYGVMVPLVADMALPALGWLPGKLKWEGTHKVLNAPKDWMQKTHISKNVTVRQAVNDGVQIGFTAIQTYGVAKGFVENMAAMKEMYTDITGQPAPSTMAMLTGDLPPMMVETRKHFIMEYGSRGLLQAAGWGLMIRDLMKGHLHKPEEIEAGRIGIVAGIVPSIVGMGVDMLMGQSVTEVYSGFKKAFESGLPIGPNEYAAFILASSTDLANRRVGKQVAMEIGMEYAKEKAPPGEILRQMNDGRFKARIDQLITKDEAAFAQKQAAQGQKTQPHAPAKELSMVEKVNGAKPQDRPKLGHFTGMVNEQANGLAPNMTRP